MSTLKVNTVLSADTPTVNITDGLNVTGVSTVTTLNTTNLINATALTNRNLIVNGAMTVAQRGTSSTDNGYGSVDRFQSSFSATDESPTQTQHTLTSSDTGPYAEGFRKSFHVQNGNQTSGAGASDFIRLWYKIEAQDLANSGWNYTSSSSYITLSFWVKSSVAQTYYVQMRTQDGTSKSYYFAMNLSANTWTKVTHSIPGHADLQFDNDTNEGIYIAWYTFRGTNNTGSVTANQWNDYSGSTLTPNQTTTWYTTNDSTYEITGVQLELGSVATPFEHRTTGDELQRCRRYYQVLVDQDGGTSQKSFAIACAYSSSSMHSTHLLSPEMRAVPTLDYTTGTDYYRAFSNGSADPFNEFNLVGNSHPHAVDLAVFSDLSVTSGSAVLVRTYNAAARVAFTAEL